MYYFLREDLDRLDQEIARINTEVEKSLREMGESCTQSSETWHDNFGYEEGKRQAAMWSQRLADLVAIRQQAVICDRPINPDKVVVGACVKIREIVSQEEKEFVVGSYTSFEAEDGRVSYDAPIAKILMGGKVGEFKQGEIAGTRKTFKIISIS